MSDEKYRATIVYRRTRPYYPEKYSGDSDYFRQDIEDVGKTKELVVGPYSTIATVKAGIARVKNEYPLANIYGDDELGYEIEHIVWQVSHTAWSVIEAP